MHPAILQCRRSIALAQHAEVVPCSDTRNICGSVITLQMSSAVASSCRLSVGAIVGCEVPIGTEREMDSPRYIVHHILLDAHSHSDCNNTNCNIFIHTIIIIQYVLCIKQTTLTQRIRKRTSKLQSRWPTEAHPDSTRRILHTTPTVHNLKTSIKDSDERAIRRVRDPIGG